MHRERSTFCITAGSFWTEIKQLHAIPVSGDDSDTLADERRSNGLRGPTILELHRGISARLYPALNPQLVWVHQVITKTWLDTGKVF